MLIECVQFVTFATDFPGTKLAHEVIHGFESRCILPKMAFSYRFSDRPWRTVSGSASRSNRSVSSRPDSKGRDLADGEVNSHSRTGRDLAIALDFHPDGC